jgi:arginase
VQQTEVQNALASGVADLVREVDEIHLHIDPDVLDSKEAPANTYQFLAEGGMSLEQLREAIDLIKQNLKVTSATVASFDPECDPQGVTRNALVNMIKQIIASK